MAIAEPEVPVNLVQSELGGDAMSEDILGRVWLFAGLNQDKLDAIAHFTFQKSFDRGDLIVEEGETGNGLYIIVSGKVEILKGLGTENQVTLGERASGEIFGEMALLGEWPRTATVRSLGKVECLGIDRWVFLSLLERQPQIGINMLQILAQRLRECDARLAE